MKNMRLYAKYYSAFTGEKERVYKPHEAKSLADFVDCCMRKGAKVEHFDGFFYGYIIPQIGKEFDILKVSNDKVLNIELKSWVGDIEAVKQQLIKNKFYLAHLTQKPYFYTFNSDTSTLYKLTENNELTVCDLQELIEVNKSISAPISGLIDDLFAVSQFIVSPTENPYDFLEGKYFLTLQQQQIKRKTLDELKNEKFIKISGSPGTGKTLLLYSLAKDLLKTGSVCFLQQGAIENSQNIIESKTGLKFVKFNEEKVDFSNFDYVVIDEGERYSDKAFNKILYALKSSPAKAVFAFERSDIMQSGTRSISSIRMARLRGATFTLSGKIRINAKINDFIFFLFGGAKAQKNKDFSGVQIFASNTKKQTAELLNYLKTKGYNRIYEGEECVHKSEKERGDIPLSVAYGKEYDNVAVVICSNFYYTEKGKLYDKRTGKFAENLYYAITRVRKKLCVIIENNEPVLERALNIKSGKNYKSK